MKIALVGAAGQLAFDLVAAASRHEVIPLDRTSLDIRDRDTVMRVLSDLRPEVVINTAAYNLVDKAESEPLEAFANNAVGPQNLADACAKLDIALVHFSTDYVFETPTGERSTPWTEDDAPFPVSVYGTSKLAGEFAVRARCRRHLVLRACGLYGVKGSRGKGGNFVETMLRLAEAGKPIRVVSDQVCTPSFTADVASATVSLLERNATGLFHVTNAGSCSWHEFAQEIFRQASLPVDCQPIASADFGAAARRPRYSVLDCGKLAQTIGHALPSWQDGLARYLAIRKPQQTR